MAYILCIETTTKNCSVALSYNGELVACKETCEDGYSHAENLHVFITEMLNIAKIKLQDLAAIAVSQGPGSYTGLRIGVSAAKGLCFALQIPLLAIDTLEILARQLTIKEGVILPMIDARRMECYTATFDKNWNKKQDVMAQIITSNTYDSIIQTIHIIGDGAHKCKSVLQDKRMVFYDTIIFPSAKQMAEIAFIKYQNNQTVDVAYFEPFYLKEFQLNS